MQKVNKHTVLKAARDNGSWEGYVTGSKVNSYHIAGGWNLGYKVEIKAIKTNDGWEYMVNEDHKLENYVDNVLYHIPSELGTRVSFWAEDKL